ncbi:MAG: Gfo/Idh/MocA family oxidoreductase [Kiritimatiellae bacterium]|nr:Gfo/Idh/MocA family oxidoreductase [Kiritimatiellia bacterium]MDD5521751.1 Gfo/Idh/MocA family oxidoreductase [Kiritimatiellia bacterium]
MKRNHSSRRSFLKTSVVALGATVFSRPLILSGAEARSTVANSKLNLALVGCGGQGRSDMRGLISRGANLVALCDPDQAMIDNARADALKSGGEATKAAKAYEDYRQLLDKASSFDAVVIGTPDHWHAPLCHAFMKANKHVYCEKPLTHSVAETRKLREMSRTCKVVTQMGNQGSASASLRRCTEIIKANVLGQIREIYHWGVGVTANEGSAEGEDPVPSGFNWDLWVGPSALRPFKKDVYHPFRWRSWFDFGNGGLADICCHAINLPMRALDLGYPEKIVINMQDGKQLAGKAAVEFHFPARGSLVPVRLHWQGSGTPSAEILQPLVEVYKDKIPGGLMIVGEKGCIYTSHWNTGGLIRLQGEPRLKDVLHHDATKDIPETLPRTPDHGQEWIDACHGQGKTFSDFDTGGKLTEIGLAGVVGIRAGKSLDWDGEKMEARNAPEAAKFIRTEYRKKWLT